MAVKPTYEEVAEKVKELEKNAEHYKRSQMTLKLNEERLESLLKLSKIRDLSEKQLVEYSLEEVVRLTNSKIGYLHFVGPDQKSIQLYSWSQQALKDCVAEKTEHYPLDKAGVWADCIRLKEPAIHNDYQRLPTKKGYPAGHSHVIRHASVPVWDGDQIVAIVGVGNKVEPYDHTDVLQLSLFVNSLWGILQRKRAEEERENLIQDLKKALAEVKTLSGLLPICSSCKKIRDDKGYWKQIEAYIRDHSEAEFSHGICPECAQRLYPDIEL